jgi:4-hydroxy-4-methyl-2-oxoglutarate aldolase
MLTVLLLWSSFGSAQVVELPRERMIEFTAKNPFDRFPDGRPKVPDELLARIRNVTLTHAWELLRQKGYSHQFAGGFEILHEGKKLVGRALTAQYHPLRPDLEEVITRRSLAAGKTTRQTQMIVDILTKDDVPVVDLMGAAAGHNFGGDNLHAAMWAATRTGVVVDGTIRDIEGILELGSQVFFRGAHPAAVANVSVVGINVPIRIGEAAVMPGDVVLGDRTGVVFIPPHLVNDVLRATGK